MPNNPRAGGVSRRIEGDDRNELKAAMADVVVPDSMGTIVRTAGVGRTTEELQWDLDYQAEIWKAIQDASSQRAAPFLVYQESNIIVRALRDYFRSDIGEIIADEQATYDQSNEFIRMYMPQNQRKLKMHSEDVPLFNRYQIESQIESAFRREVRLPSGGALVIDHTEALISIDINSARATKGQDIEETATNTNLEASDEIARQLRLRDLGGLVVIDFIDMMSNKHQRAVENRLREALKQDRARVQVGRISRFGLLEMSRQRLRPSLGETSENVCPRCQGHGTVRGIESTALSILRLLEEESMKDNTERVLAEVPVEVATYLLNEKRTNIGEIEARNQVTLLIVANPILQTPNYTLERIRGNESDHNANNLKSYELQTDGDDAYNPTDSRDEQAVEQAAVSTVVPDAPAPARREKPDAKSATVEKAGISRFFGAVSSLFGASPSTETEVTESDVNEHAGLTDTSRRSSNNRAAPGQRRARGDNNQDRNNRTSSKKTAGRRKKRGAKKDGNNQAREEQAQNENKPRSGRGRGRGRNQNKEKVTATDAVEENTDGPNSSSEEQSEKRESQSDKSDKQESPKRSRNRRPARGRNKKENGTETNTESDSAASDSTSKDKPANNQKTNKSNNKGGRSRGRHAGQSATTTKSEVDSNGEPNGNVIPPEPQEVNDINGNVEPSESTSDRESSSNTRRRRGPGKRRQRVNSKSETSENSADAPTDRNANDVTAESSMSSADATSPNYPAPAVVTSRSADGSAANDSSVKKTSTDNDTPRDKDTSSAASDNKTNTAKNEPESHNSAAGSNTATTNSSAPASNVSIGNVAENSTAANSTPANTISSSAKTEASESGNAKSTSVKPASAAPAINKPPKDDKKASHLNSSEGSGSAVPSSNSTVGGRAKNAASSIATPASNKSASTASPTSPDSATVAKPTEKASTSAADKPIPTTDSDSHSGHNASADTDGQRISQRQPSQLKSSVRSLANKDEPGSSTTSNGGLSFASRKVADVKPQNGEGSKKPAKPETSDE